MSPFLFILVTDVLGRMIDAAKARGRVCGLKVRRGETHITYLQFADDLLLFVEGNKNLVKDMMRVVHAF
ncbi:hypothetical protein Sjap_015944 [Stephania japonica]|uniref:Reverse transcriptase domain-containing protein n=1 Tax=Stephania japonica TaxID=461633 RepID=A0AAP0IKC8_9MAGN